MTVLFQEIMGGIASIFENISPKLNGPIIVKKKRVKSRYWTIKLMAEGDVVPQTSSQWSPRIKFALYPLCV